MNDQDNFELKMRIFYLEEKLSRLCSPPSPSSSSVHPVKDDASRMLGDKEDTIRVMEEELNRSNREVESLRGRLSATEDELLQLSDSLDSHRTSSSSLSSRLTTALTQNATLKEEIKAAREKIDRSLVEREITGQTGELLNSYRQHNEKLTSENGSLAVANESLESRNVALTDTVKSLRLELSSIASLSPEDTRGGEISEAIKKQLDSYQVKAREDAGTIEKAVGRLEIVAGENEVMRDKIERLESRNSTVELKLKSTTAELSTLARYPSGSLSGSKGVREMLESQGAMAGSLARKELEVESLKSSLEDAVGRAKRAEDSARRMTEQMNLIKSTSEEVAMLEAEEIDRLEGELREAREGFEEERRRRGEEEERLGVRAEKLTRDAEDAKGEVLRLKRENNKGNERIQRLSNELNSMRGYSQDVANRLHSVQFSGHVRDVLGSNAGGAEVDPTSGGQSSVSGSNAFFNGYLTGLPSQTSFRPIGTLGAATKAESLVPIPANGCQGLESRRTDYTSELELLYIQREKELLDKLADTMTKVRVYEDDDKAPEQKKRGTRWHNSEQRQNVPTSLPGPDLQPPLPPPSPPISPRRNPKPGLHQPTASSLAKNEVQIMKKKKFQQKVLKKGVGRGGGKVNAGRVSYPKTGAAFHDAVVDVVEGRCAAQDSVINDTTNFPPTQHKTFTNYYDPTLTPIPFDKQLRKSSPIPLPVTFNGHHPLASLPTPKLTPPGNPFSNHTPYSTMSALTQCFLEARTPLDDLRDRLRSDAL